MTVWGAIGHYFKTGLYFFRENLKAKLYQKILNARLPPNYSVDCPSGIRGGWIFLQDNDPKHTAISTTALLDELAPDRIRDHPPRSPDLNPMEDIWSYLDGEIKKKRIPWDYAEEHSKYAPASSRSHRARRRAHTILTGTLCLNLRKTRDND